MSAVAAMTALLKSFGIRHDSNIVKCRLCRLATELVRRERAAVRRARGRTVAWAIGSPVYEFAGQKDTRAIGYDWSFFEEPVNVRMTQAMGKRVARVVAVPRKGGRRD